MLNLLIMRLRDLQEIHLTNPTYYDSATAYRVDIVAIYLDLDPEEVWTMHGDDLDQHYQAAVWAYTHPPACATSISVGGKTLTHIPYTALTLGAYIDIEHYIQTENYMAILPILYRQQIQATPWDTITYEPYEGWVEERLPLFMAVPVAEVWGAISAYNEWQATFLTAYSGLFELPYEDETASPPRTVAEKLAVDRAQERTAYNWETTILTAVEGDITKVQTVLNMPLILFFNLLSAKKVTGSPLL